MDITLGYRGNLYLKPGYRIFRSNTMQDTLYRGNFDLNQDTGYRIQDTGYRIQDTVDI